jgi:hypothetical protein
MQEGGQAMESAASIMARSRRRRASGVFAIGVGLCLGLAGAFPAQAQELDWARSAGGTGLDLGNGIATDRRGNGYVTGEFSGTATFGAGEANQTELTAAGFNDIFVAKYRDVRGRRLADAF